MLTGQNKMEIVILFFPAFFHFLYGATIDYYDCREIWVFRELTLGRHFSCMNEEKEQAVHYGS